MILPKFIKVNAFCLYIGKEANTKNIRKLFLHVKKMELETDSNKHYYSEGPTILVTNDDGIEAIGLKALVSVLVSTHQFNVLVCAPQLYVYIHFFLRFNLAFNIIYACILQNS